MSDEKSDFGVDSGNLLANRTLSLIAFVLVCFCCTTISFSHAEDMTSLREIGFGNPHFSREGKLLAFDLCRNNNCESVIHDTEANTFTKYVDRQGRKISNLSFSPVGADVLFVVMDQPFWPWQKNTQQLATGLQTGVKFKLITESGDVKMYPTFFGGDAVLYWGAEVVKRGSRRSYQDTRLVEVDIKSKHSQTAISTKFDFFRPSAPYPLNDGDLIVASDYGFHQPGSRYEEHKKSTQKDELLVLSKSKNTVTPLETGIDNSSNPVVIRQTGQVAFIGRLGQSEGQKGYVYDVFLRGTDGVTRLTALRTYISAIDVTADGKMLALVLESDDQKLANGRLVIYDIRANKYREIHPKNIIKISVDIES